MAAPDLRSISNAAYNESTLESSITAAQASQRPSEDRQKLDKQLPVLPTEIIHKIIEARLWDAANIESDLSNLEQFHLSAWALANVSLGFWRRVDIFFDQYHDAMKEEGPHIENTAQGYRYFMGRLVAVVEVIHNPEKTRLRNEIRALRMEVKGLKVM